MQEMKEKLKKLINKKIDDYLECDCTPTPDELLKITDVVARYNRITTVYPGYLKDHSDKSEGTKTTPSNLSHS